MVVQERSLTWDTNWIEGLGLNGSSSNVGDVVGELGVIKVYDCLSKDEECPTIKSIPMRESAALDGDVWLGIYLHEVNQLVTSVIIF